MRFPLTTSPLLVTKPFRQQHQPLLEQQPDDADDEDGDDDVRDVEVVPLVPYPEADADAAGEHFGGDDDEPGHADREPYAGQYMGQHRGKQDLGEDLELR